MLQNDLIEVFDYKYYGNTTSSWLIALGVFVATVAIIAGIKALVVRRLGAKAKRTSTEIDDVAVDLIRRTRPYFFTVLALHATAQGLLSLPSAVYRVLHLLTIAAVLLQTLVWGSGLIDYFVKRYTDRQPPTDRSSIATIRAVGFFARFLLLVILILAGLHNVGINITALVAGLGIGGVAIALAIQNILGDLFAALSIMTDKPFVIGDTIAVDDMTGTVENIGLKTTRIRAITGEQLIFANGDLLKSRIRNFRRMYERRVVFTIKVPYETDRAKLAEIPGIIRKIIESRELVRFDRSHFLAFTDQSLNIETVYFVLTSDYGLYADTHQAINLAIMDAFDTAGIEFAYPRPTMILQSAPPAIGGPGPAISAPSASPPPTA